MIALRLRRMIASLLAASLLSSQLVACVPSLCECGSASAAGDKSCCTKSHTIDSGISRCCPDADSGDLCSCGFRGESVNDCDCSNSNDKQPANRRNGRIQVGENDFANLAIPVLPASRARGCASSHRPSSPDVERISARTLFCVWLI